MRSSVTLQTTLAQKGTLGIHGLPERRNGEDNDDGCFRLEYGRKTGPGRGIWGIPQRMKSTGREHTASRLHCSNSPRGNGRQSRFRGICFEAQACGRCLGAGRPWRPRRGKRGRRAGLDLCQTRLWLGTFCLVVARRVVWF